MNKTPLHIINTVIKESAEIIGLEEFSIEPIEIYTHNVNGINQGVWDEFTTNILGYLQEPEFTIIIKTIFAKLLASKSFGGQFEKQNIEMRLREELKPYFSLLNTSDSFSCGLAIPKLPFTIQVLLLKYLNSKQKIQTPTVEDVNLIKTQIQQKKEFITQQIQLFCDNLQNTLPLSDFILLLEMQVLNKDDFKIIEFFTKLFLSPTSALVKEKYGEEKQKYYKQLLLNSLVYKQFYSQVKTKTYTPVIKNSLFS